MRYQWPVRGGFGLPSGRVIAVGRLMMATLFMLALWMEVGQPTRAQAPTYMLVGGYVVVAAVLLAVTWSSWWTDAKLAGAAHAIDIAIFTFLVFSTAGYTSLLLTLFMFILLAAAIRWGWRATALTAVLLILLYLAAELLVTSSTDESQLRQAMMQTGQLVILSLVLIWFGINQSRSSESLRPDELLNALSLDESPLETSLRAAMKRLRARAGIFVWRDNGSSESTTLVAREEGLSVERSRGAGMTDVLAAPFLYDLRDDRALARDERRNVRFAAASEVISPQAASAASLREGIAIPVRTGAGEGELFLEGPANLSTDHIELAEQVAADVVAHIQGHALLKVTEEGAEARSRLSLARDLHDSVVQFLAGAAFRLEAMKRRQVSGGDIVRDLEELKQQMLEEQAELRLFINALRSGPLTSLDHLAKDLKALSEKLSKQWGLRCAFSAETAEMMIPARLHLDSQQLVREAVANAARHAGASSVKIRLEAMTDGFRLEFINDGARFPKIGEFLELPRSIRERVEQAGGEVDLTRGMDVTRLSISLPAGGAGR